MIEHVLIVVPARDETASIAASLASINVARRRLPDGVSSALVVVADCCNDDTVDVALDAIRSHRDDDVLIADVGTAGAARHAGTRHLFADTTLPPERVWIANTDADTIVEPDWLTIQLELAAAGHIGVAGVVRLDARTVDDPALAVAFSAAYGHVGESAHRHVHGANIGFRADAYNSVGGWNPLATGEDHDLWNRLRHRGRVISTTSLSVSTSARLVGRAPDGFAADLANLMDAIGPVA